MEIIQSSKDGRHIVEISGDLTVSDGMRLKKALLGNLKKGGRLELVFSEVTGMDLSAVQILASTVKTTGKKDVELSIRTPVPEPVYRGLEVSGFLNHTNCPKKNCVWCSIREQAQGAEK